MFFADKYHQNYGMSLAKMTIMSVMRHHPHILFLLRKWRVCALVLAILCICAVGISCFLRQSGKNELSRLPDMYRDHGLPYDIPSLFATIEKHNIETNEKYNSLYNSNELNNLIDPNASIGPSAVSDVYNDELETCPIKNDITEKNLDFI